jgi:putative membrane protein
MIRKTELIINFFKGMVIGIANLIPGVSGGTMAFVLGIYEKLVESIGKFITNKKNRKDYILFLLPIVLGAAAGIIIFARVFSFLLSSDIYAQPTYFFFIGLILGSLPFLITFHPDMKIKVSRILFLIIGIVFVILIALAGGKENLIDAPRTKFTILNIFNITGISIKYAFWLFFCGLLASAAMVIPGVSGSAILLGLGEYKNILYFVSELMIVQLVVFGAGVVIGIVGSAKLIDYLLKKFPSNTYYFIIGLVIASIFQIVMQFLDNINLSFLSILLSVIAMGVGFALAYGVSKIKKTAKDTDD